MDGLQDRSGVGVEASGRSRGGRSRAGRRNYVSDGRPASRALALRARLIYDAHHMSAATAGRTAPSRKEVTHERIVAAAARATRRTGYDGTVVARHSPDQGAPGAYKRALVTVATMVGALVLARAVDYPKLSKALREASLKHLDPTGT